MPKNEMSDTILSQVEARYSKLTQREHILTRPNMYIGSTAIQQEEAYVWNAVTSKIECKTVSFSPGLLKLFDEILVNALDNRRHVHNKADELLEANASSPDKTVWVVPKMDKLMVDYDVETNEISVLNNGKCIPVLLHSKHQLYIPDLLLGSLLTSSNYNDQQMRTTGGSFGVGGAAVNIFSLQFTVEIADTERKLKYKQTWTDNMSQKGAPQITALKEKDLKKGDYTKVSFRPDLQRFGGMKSLVETDILSLIERRVIDAACTSNVDPSDQDSLPKLKVWINQKRVPINTFKEYIHLYHSKEQQAIEDIQDRSSDAVAYDKEVSVVNAIEEDKPLSPLIPSAQSSDITKKSKLPKVSFPCAYKKVNARWEVGVMASDDRARNVSFVNAISIPDGGTHVDHVRDQIGKYMSEFLEKKHKVSLKPHVIMNQLFVFVNCLIDNAEFEGQIKGKLKTPKAKFGSTCELDDNFMNQIVDKTDVVKHILAYSQLRTQKDLKQYDGKKSRRIFGLEKLEDANKAGSKESDQCTLWLAEGDSAKAFVVAGLSVIGRDYNGVFPLKGNPLNVRQCTLTQALQNKEIQNIIKIMGLVRGKKYTDTKELRYGKVMLTMDSDDDARHLCGLLMDVICYYWPELFRMNGFIRRFITPIITEKHKSSGKKLNFFSVIENEHWSKEQQEKGTDKDWIHKYIKGLGGFTAEDAREFFGDLEKHVLYFHYDPKAFEAMELAFGPNQEPRKVWVMRYIPGSFLDTTQKTLTYSDFIHKELIIFSVASNVRAIPSLVDGLKPSQRKILYACFRRHLTKELKVAQLAGNVAEVSAYHHGEMSLNKAIVGLAQNYVGSNNINLLHPCGQFGGRAMCGKDFASPRYIFTYLDPITRTIFPQSDDALMDYVEDDGQRVEPVHYVPILPFILINGCSGIGTGFASDIPNYNPREVVDNIRLLLQGKDPVMLHPWYRDFKGTIVKEEAKDSSKPTQKYHVFGRIEKVDALTLRIDELPIGFGTSAHKMVLEKLIETKEIQEFRECHTDTTVDFIIKMTPAQADKMATQDVYKKFQLISYLSTSNMMLFDHKQQLRKYASVIDIIKEFFPVRLQLYYRRKEMMVAALEEQLDILQNKIKYIQLVRTKQIDLAVSNYQILNTLVRKGFKRVKTQHQLSQSSESLESSDSSDFLESCHGTIEDKDEDSRLSDFYYLLNQTQLSLTVENSQRFADQVESKEKELQAMIDTTPEDMWHKDLDKFLTTLNEFELRLQQSKGTVKVLESKSKKRKQSQDQTKTFKRKKQDSITANPVNPLTLVTPVYLPPPPILGVKKKLKRKYDALALEVVSVPSAVLNQSV